MPDQIGQSNYDCDGRSRQSMQSYRSVWLAHWMQTACNTAPQIQSCPFGNTDGNSAKQSHLLIKRQAEDDVSRSAKEIESRTSEIMNENSRNGRSGCQPFPNFYPCRNTGSTSVADNDQDKSHMEALRPQNMQKFKSVTALHTSRSHFSSVHKVATPATEHSVRVGHLQHETRLRNHSEPRKPQKLSESCFADTRSAYHIVPYQANYGEDRLESGKNAPSSFICRGEEVNQLRSVLASEERLPSASLTGLEPGQSASFVCEKTMDGHLDYVSAIQNLRQGNIRRLIHDPSASSNHSPAFGGEEYQRMQNHTGIVMFPVENSPIKMTKSEKLDHGSLKRIPGSVQDVETMRICTGVDSVEGLPGWPARYSQTTHSLLIKKRGDVNLCKEKQIFRESRISSQIEGTAIGKLHSLCPLFGHFPRVKLQKLRSSNESEVKENVDIINAYEIVSENESSAETDTVDVDAFGDKNFLSGECCSPLGKDTKLEPNPLQRVESKHPAIELPDINLVPPTLPSAASLMECAEPSTSRTQSLDMELLLSHAERLGNAESNDHQDGLLRSEPTSRWLKRLKSSASDTPAVGTKSLNLDQDLSHGKVNKFLNTVMKKNITSLEPTYGKRTLDQVSSIANKDGSSSVDTVTKAKPITLSHSWIQRWRQSGVAFHENKAKNVVVCEPQTSKMWTDDSEKKEFPSIAAVAPMAKVKRGFQPPCKFRKEGSFVVWNTRSL